MAESVSCAEFDAECRALLNRIDALLSRVDDLERGLVVGVSLCLKLESRVSHLARVLRSVVSPEQWAAFEAEFAAGVTDGAEVVLPSVVSAGAEDGVEVLDPVGHVWRVGDLCTVVLEESPRFIGGRRWRAFFDAAEAQQYAAHLAETLNPHDCDGVLVRVTLAQVTQVNLFGNDVSAWNEQTIVV